MQLDELLKLIGKGHGVFWRKVLRPEQFLCRVPLFGSVELFGVRHAARQIRKHTCCDLSGLLDFLEGALGFSLGIVCGLASLGEF